MGSIPANRINVVVFDLCNFTLIGIVLSAAFNFMWHLRFYAGASDLESEDVSIVKRALRYDKKTVFWKLETQVIFFTYKDLKKSRRNFCFQELKIT